MIVTFGELYEEKKPSLHLVDHIIQNLPHDSKGVDYETLGSLLYEKTLGGVPEDLSDAVVAGVLSFVLDQCDQRGAVGAIAKGALQKAVVDERVLSFISGLSRGGANCAGRNNDNERGHKRISWPK